MPAARVHKIVKGVELLYCRGCDIFKGVDCFHKRSSTSDGYMLICKPCKSKLDKRYREEHKEKTLAKARFYYHANKDEINKRRGTDLKMTLNIEKRSLVETKNLIQKERVQHWLGVKNITKKIEMTFLNEQKGGIEETIMK